MVPSSCIPTHPNGRPMPAPPQNHPIDQHDHSNNGISVASFNLLAPLYIRPIDQRTGKIQPFASFDWISEGEESERILGNDHRLPRLLQCMQDCGCDFICVQELQLERGEQELELLQDDDDDGQKQNNSNSSGRSRKSRSRKEDCGDPMDTESNLSTLSTPKFTLPKWITPLIQCSTSSNDGNDMNNNIPYGIILPPQTELEKIAERNRRVLLADAAITNAIFYRSDKWKPTDRRGKGEDIMNNMTTCVMQAFLSTNGNTDEQWNDDDDDDRIVISSIHLDACSEEKRVQQLQRCLEQSLLLSVTSYIPPCIIAGDFNCELFDGSCVNEFLATDDSELNNGIISPSPSICYEGDVVHLENRKKECASALRLPSGILPSKEQMKSWDELHGSVTKFINDQLLSLKRIDTGCTRVAYDHDEDSSSTTTTIPDQQSQRRTMAQWHLDHIVYTPSTLVPKAKWSTLEEDEHSRTVGLPNDRVPTDHLPIAALFERHPHPRLSEESKKGLEEMLNGMEMRQNLELQYHTEEVERKRVDLEQQYREKNGGESTETEQQQQPTKKTKKKAKSPPPPEIIQHIRSSRAVTKQLKLEQSMERQKFLNEMEVLERMVLQHILGRDITCTQWVEIGGRAIKK